MTTPGLPAVQNNHTDDTVGAQIDHINTDGITVPSPSEEDLEWAMKLKSKWGKDRTGYLFSCAQSGKVWQTAFLLSLYTKKEITLNLKKQRNYRSPMAVAVERGHLDVISLFAQNDIPLDDNSITRAFYEADEVVWRQIFSLGTKPEEVLRISRNAGSSSSSKKALYNVIKEVFPDRLEEFHLTSQEMEHTFHNCDQDDETGLTWEKVSNQKVVSIEKVQATQTTIQTIFNFMAAEVHTIFSGSDSRSSPVMAVSKFSEFENDECLTLAFNKLKALGGNPTEIKLNHANKNIAPKSFGNDK